MKNIAIFIPTIDSGGAEKQAVLLAVELSKYTKVSLIVLHGDHPAYKNNMDKLSESSVVVHKLAGSLLSKVVHVRKILKQTETTVLFNYLTMPDVLGSLIGYSLNIKVYNGIRTSRLPRHKALIEKLVNNLIVTGTVYNSYSGAIYFADHGFDKAKSIIIPNCFPDIAEPISRENKSLKTIITVGRFDAAKDYKTLIQSIAGLNRNDFCLTIVGYGELEEQIREWIKYYQIEDKTRICIKPDNVSELERSADIYVSTSIYEGTSNSIMEALNWSLPVVATNVGDNDRLIVDGVNGYLCGIEDVNTITESLNTLLDSVELRNTMGIRGNDILRKYYSIDIFRKKYLELIEENI